MTSFDVISMPDPWEYPWYAAWDLAFHCVAIARVDPAFAKEQLLLLLREWYMHPNGQIPAYEWAFGDVNPPVHAWAALRVFEIDGGRDYDFLARVHAQAAAQLHLVGQPQGRRRQQRLRGRLPRAWTTSARSTGRRALPVAGVLEQSDGTGWMAMYALNLLEMALRAGRCTTGPTRTSPPSSSSTSRTSPTAAYEQGLWDDEDAFFYDVLRLPDGHAGAAEGALGGRPAAAGARPPCSAR